MWMSSENFSQREELCPPLSFPPAFHLECRHEGWSLISYLRSKGRSYILWWEKDEIEGTWFLMTFESSLPVLLVD